MAQVKRIRRNVSGIILLDKPLGFTSNAALQKVRWLLNAEKAGHTGSCLLYTSPSPRDLSTSRMPSSA